jgi:hypothetical protein
VAVSEASGKAAGFAIEVNAEQLVVGERPSRSSLTGLASALVVEVWRHGGPELNPQERRCRGDALFDNEDVDGYWSGFARHVLNAGDGLVQPLRQPERLAVDESCVCVLDLFDADQQVGDVPGRVEGHPVRKRCKQLRGDDIDVALELVAIRLPEREDALRR